MGVREDGHFRRVIVGYDGSPESERAPETALAMAPALNSKVLVLSVACPNEPETSAQWRAGLQEARERYEKGQEHIRERAQKNGLQVETAFAVGRPAQQITHRAEEDHADLIVIGQRGGSGVHKIFLGSVSQQILQHAHCPVMVVR
jgi:nucleotide-binding universal stress UspA family protein